MAKVRSPRSHSGAGPVEVGEREVTAQDADAMTALFRRHGLKVTPQRQCIVEILHADLAHPTAEAIYGIARERMPSISLKTVYETLHTLAAVGHIQEIDLGVSSARFDIDVHHHHHLVCSGCGQIENVDLEEFGPIALGAAEDHGFLLGHAEVILRGRCQRCTAGDG